MKHRECSKMFENVRKLSMAAALLLAACTDDPEATAPVIPVEPTMTTENLIICNEGNWQSDNGQLSYYDAATGTLTNQWFRKVNGMKLGDTPNDIIQVNDTLIAIAINWSNIIQYIHPDGTACGATENVPNNRRLCSDGRFLYVTSYAHKCGSLTFTKGYVAKIDIATKEVVGTCEVGWEPEGVKLYDGRLYVANTGGYAFSEGHEYETTVSVVDAATMRPIKTIDTGHINLYGEMSQAGQWLCINSPGDYYDVAPATIILDCETDECSTLPFPSTYSATDGERFYTVGSEFSYLTGEYVYHIHTITPAAESSDIRISEHPDVRTSEYSVIDDIISPAVTAQLRSLTSPYALYVSPHTGNVYFTDAKSYATAGYLYGYNREGEPLFAPQKVYINPGHILAVKSSPPPTPPSEGEGALVTVLEYCPAPGQFVNTMPEATADDTPETMTEKCTATLREGGLVTLGGFGGYITFTLGQSVENVPGQPDFTIHSNASATSAEPGIVMVSVDTNSNGLPDDEWYELSGSADIDSPDAVDYGYEITYRRAPMQDIPWTDNRGGAGTLSRVSAHTQEYFPLWIKDDALTFRGTRLPSNGEDTSGNGSYWVLSPFRYGYADNLPNSDADGNAFDIDRAVDADHQPVHLTHIDFIRVYTALHQQCGWLGETSTEISAASPLRLTL